MSPALQGTISTPVSFKGKGLHTGKRAQITIYPADANMGIVFRRIDKSGRNTNEFADNVADSGTEILAHWKNTKKLPLCTCIASAENDLHVRTIEHLMAAFYACGIDNALIDVNGTELPILDGSAQQYVKKINEAGVKQQDVARRIFKVTKTFEIRENDNCFLKIEPADSLSIDVTIALLKIGRLNWSGEMTPALFSEQISSARTFGRLKNGLLAQLTRFRKDPICLGANTKSAVVVVRGDKVLNKGGLRMPDEYVRHRLLDLVGDLMLSGGHIQGKITAFSPAHRMTHELLRQIFTEQAFIEISGSDENS